MAQKQKISIRDLYPHLSEDQLKEAEENLEQYLELELRVYKRLEGDDPEALVRLKALTASKEEPTIEK